MFSPTGKWSAGRGTEPWLLCGPVLAAPPLLLARSLSHTLCSLLTRPCLPLLVPACLQLPPSAQGSEEIATGLGVGEDSSCTISWMQAWGKSELVRKESALVPLVADSFGASWPFPLPLPLHPGVHHPVYPSTEAAVLQAAHPLWVGAKEVCKRGNWYPYPCVFILHQTTN